jgi:hypothetical protein
MASIPSAATLKRAVSNVGKAAAFGTPDEEVARILKHKQNYYICLKVRSTFKMILERAGVLFL